MGIPESPTPGELGIKGPVVKAELTEIRESRLGVALQWSWMDVGADGLILSWGDDNSYSNWSANRVKIEDQNRG